MKKITDITGKFELAYSSERKEYGILNRDTKRVAPFGVGYPKRILIEDIQNRSNSYLSGFHYLDDKESKLFASAEIELFKKKKYIHGM